MLTESAIYM